MAQQQDGASHLRQVIGGAPPSEVSALEAAAQAELADLIAESRKRQQQQLGQALEDALGHLPRLLRGPVRRVLFPKRGGGS